MGNIVRNRLMKGFSWDPLISSLMRGSGKHVHQQNVNFYVVGSTKWSI
jgi:hypothetical protein